MEPSASSAVVARQQGSLSVYRLEQLTRPPISDDDIISLLAGLPLVHLL